MSTDSKSEPNERITGIVIIGVDGWLSKESDLISRLQQEDFPVKVIRDCSELETVLTAGEYYHIIILADYRTICGEKPGWDGYKQFLASYARHWQNRSIDLMIIARRSDLSDEILHASQGLVSAYMSIPFYPDELFSIIHRMRNYALDYPNGKTYDL